MSVQSNSNAHPFLHPVPRAGASRNRCGAAGTHKSRKASASEALFAVCVLGGILAVPAMRAQAPAKPSQNPPAQQKPTPPAESNPFPVDTTNVPVIPTTETAAPSASDTDVTPPSVPSDESDPVRSPDDASPLPSSGSSSSSSAGLDLNELMPANDETGRHHGKSQPPEHKETAKEDENVGSYYLDNHNWKGALSRFESALVLDPENPDVYWGLAEAQFHLGQFAAAKANYEKVMEYDPGSRHAKDAKKILRQPELANAAPPPAKP